MPDTYSWPPRDVARRGLAFWCTIALAVVITAVTFVYAAVGGSAKPPRLPPAATGTGNTPGAHDVLARLRGYPLRGDLGVRLLLTTPPRHLDPASGRTTPIRGLPGGRGTYRAFEVGGTAVLLRTRECLDCVPAGEAFVVRDRAARSLGQAWAIAPSVDGQGVWIMRYAGEHECTLREVDLRGNLRHPERPIDCRARPRLETSAGLLLDVTDRRYRTTETVLLDPDSGQVMGRYPRIEATTPRYTLTSGGASPSSRPELAAAKAVGDSDAAGSAAGAGPRLGARSTPPTLTLTDLQGGVRHVIPWPSPMRTIVDSAPGPNGRYLAVEFADLTGSSARQLVDVWVLDIPTGRWQRLPGMPVAGEISTTSLTWTPDGHLVLAGSFAGTGPALAGWRLGDDRLGVRLVDLAAGGQTAAFTVLSSPLGD